MQRYAVRFKVVPPWNYGARIMRVREIKGIGSIPSATGGIARMACARLDEIGKDARFILAKAGVSGTGGPVPGRSYFWALEKAVSSTSPIGCHVRPSN
jgi:hypothetical protein